MPVGICVSLLCPFLWYYVINCMKKHNKQDITQKERNGFMQKKRHRGFTRRCIAWLLAVTMVLAQPSMDTVFGAIGAQIAQARQAPSCLREMAFVLGNKSVDEC